MKTIKEPGPKPEFAFFTALFVFVTTPPLIFIYLMAIIHSEPFDSGAIFSIALYLIIDLSGIARVLYTIQKSKQWTKENEKYIASQQAIERMQNDAENARSNRMQIVNELEGLSRQLHSLQVSCNPGE